MNLREVTKFDVAHVLSRPFQQPRRVHHGGPAGKAKRDMVLSNPYITERPIPFEYRNSPGVDSFTGLRNCFANQCAYSVGHRFQFWISTLDISIDGGGSFGISLHR